MLVADLDRGPSERAARLPRGYRAASLRMLRTMTSGQASAGLFDPEFAPALRAYFAVDKCASIWLLEQRAVAALLITLWRILVLHRRLLHFRGGLLDWQQQSGGSRRAPCAVQKDDAPRQWACWYS
jgi:hypothetical protein